MSIPAAGVSVEAQNFNWLVSRFAQHTAGAIAAIAVSADGLLIAVSSELERSNADRLAAISSAMLGLAHGVSESHPLGSPDKVIIELEHGYLLVCTISIGCSLGVLANKQASLGHDRLRDGDVRQPRHRGPHAGPDRGAQEHRRSS